jgi:triacylglycerol lipase
MYYPPKFDEKRAIELGKLVNQGYQHFENFKSKQLWEIKDSYTLACEVLYRTFLSFDADEVTPPTAIDIEMEALQQSPAIEGNGSDQVSFGITDFVIKDIPVGFVATRENNAYLVFRGTVTPREWIFDANIKMTPYRVPGWGNVSDGFQNIYNRSRDSFMKKLNALGNDFELFITGHSLGGALSLLALPDVVNSTHFKKPILYNFACPRVGDDDFVKTYNALPGQQTFRVVNTSDLATSIPLPIGVPFLPSGNYSHVETPVDFTMQGNSLALNHSMSTYLAALGG